MDQYYHVQWTNECAIGFHDDRAKENSARLHKRRDKTGDGPNFPKNVHHVATTSSTARPKFAGTCHAYSHIGSVFFQVFGCDSDLDNACHHHRKSERTIT